MPALDRLARLGAAVDRAFGEQATLRAMTGTGDVNARRSPDLMRPDQIIVGIFALEQRVPFPPAKKLEQHSIRDIAANKGSFDCDEAGLAWVPRVNDLIIRMSDQRMYAIASTARDGAGRLTMLLSASA